MVCVVVLEARTFTYFGATFLLCKIGEMEQYGVKILQGGESPVMGTAIRTIIEELGLSLPVSADLCIIQ